MRHLYRDTEVGIIRNIRELFNSQNIKRMNYDSGDVIYQPDNFNNCLGLIKTGCAVVERNGVRLNLLKEGSIFGAATLFGSDNEYVTSVTAKTQCEVLFLSQEEVTEILRNDSELAIVYISFLSDKIRFLNKKIAAFTSGSAENKLIYYLAEISRGEMPETITYKELASALNIGRASLYRAIDSLSEKGFIQKDGKVIKIVDPNIQI